MPTRDNAEHQKRFKPRGCFKRIAITALTLLLFGLLVRACITRIFSCNDFESQSFLSPDERYYARRFTHFCQGPFASNVSMVQQVVLQQVGGGNEVKIFEGNNGSVKAVDWSSSKELNIEVVEVWSDVKLDQAEGIRIKYKHLVDH